MNTNLFLGQVDPIKRGERVVVPGWEHLEVFVKSVDYDLFDSIWIITLDWGEHGASRVYLHDEGKTWYRRVMLN
jgi:hypothetical protein